MDKRTHPSTNPELERRIRELIAYKGGGDNEDLVTDLIEQALKLLHDVEDRGDVKVIQTAVRELRYAFKLFAPYAGKRKVTIFGSARTSPESVEYRQAVEFGGKIADAGFMVITGAGGGGVLVLGGGGGSGGLTTGGGGGAGGGALGLERRATNQEAKEGLATDEHR